ncbi:MAG: Na/Pi cotransporter family protein [Clostridia bacterium]|nr:Na/Pi cotransporter family protein [Clostridia bacterium]
MIPILIQTFMLLGGLAFFLFGMNVMSSGLEKLSGGKLQSTLNKATNNIFKSLALGAGITIAIQSSSALTVMLVGLVNSGIMSLGSTVGVIMGSNIGTTLTAWLTSLAGLGDDGFTALLKPSSFSPLLAFIGILLTMMSKSTKKKDIGNILLGFGVLMFGMNLMGDAMEPIAEFAENNPESFKPILGFLSIPLIGVIVGAVFTGVIQSSAASVAILQNLAIAMAFTTTPITYAVAIPIIMGQNIGTCVTSLISSIGVNKNAKRVAFIHIMFNVIGTVVVLVLYIPASFFFEQYLDININAFGIAICHSIFNVFTTLLLLPFRNLLVKLANIVIKDKKGVEEHYEFIDNRLLNTPAFAIQECTHRCIEMASKAETCIISAINLCGNYDERRANDIIKIEDDIDIYEDKLGTFLVKLSKNEMSDKDNAEVSKMLHSIGDFERLGDHAVNLIKVAQEMHVKKINFTPEANADLAIARRALNDIIAMTVEAYINADIAAASNVEALEQVIDNIISSIKSRHISRLKVGECTIEHGFVLNDMLTNFERVSDHCSNIAVTMIEVDQDAYDTHEYLHTVKSIDNEEFKAKYKEYALKYKLN